MPYRPRDIYKGHRKFRTPLMTALLILAVALALFLFLFFYLQRYLVYDKDGVILDVPLLHGETETVDETSASDADSSASDEPVNVTVVYDNDDFSLLDNGTHDDLAEERLLYVSYDTACDLTAVTAAVSQAADSGYTGLVICMKDRSGVLAWSSSCETAQAYASSGSIDYLQVLAQIHEAGLTATAEISCCIDELLSERNWTVALQNADSSVYTDDDGNGWLDPYNRTVRSYVTEMTAELAAMGFDEILLDDLVHPVTDTALTYSETLQLEADPVTAVCQMARQAAAAVPAESGAVVSAVLDEDSLLSGNAAASGQDVNIFWRIFARLYCPVSAGSAADDLEAAWSYTNGGSSGARFVPICGYAPEGFGSYCIRAEG